MNSKLLSLGICLSLVVGAIVTSLPDDSETVYASGETYYYSDGTYLQATDDGQYAVAAAPTGGTVKSLPADAKMVKVEDKQYFLYNDVYYEALYGGSGVVYLVVDDPTH